MRFKNILIKESDIEAIVEAVETIEIIFSSIRICLYDESFREILAVRSEIAAASYLFDNSYRPRARPPTEDSLVKSDKTG